MHLNFGKDDLIYKSYMKNSSNHHYCGRRNLYYRCKYWIPVYTRMTINTVIPAEAGIYIVPMEILVSSFHRFSEDENDKIEGF